MNAPYLLSVGYYPELLHLRSHLLRQNGYVVKEAGDFQTAMTMARNDGSNLRLLLFCHTVPSADQTQIMMALLGSHSVPTLSICQLEAARQVPGKPVSVSPEALLAEVKQALQKEQFDLPPVYNVRL